MDTARPDIRGIMARKRYIAAVLVGLDGKVADVVIDFKPHYILEKPPPPRVFDFHGIEPLSETAIYKERDLQEWARQTFRPREFWT